MLIKQPEHIDQFFKKKLDQLPVEFKEADWQGLNKLLDQTIPTNKLKPTKISTGKLVFTVALVLSVIGGCIFLWTIRKTGKKAIQNEQNPKENVVPKNDSVKSSTPFQTPVSNPENVNRKKSIFNEKKSLENKLDTISIPSTEKQNEADSNNDIFW